MRRTAVFSTTAADKRDAGKHYLITEMSSAQGEDWAIRAMLAIANEGVDIPDEIVSMGMAGIATVGILKGLGRLKFETAKPLLDEMMSCVQIIPDINKPNVVRGLIASEDIEEILTRLKLRGEVMSLHVDFSIAAKLQNMASAAQSQPAAAESSSSV